MNESCLIGLNAYVRFYFSLHRLDCFRRPFERRRSAKRDEKIDGLAHWPDRPTKRHKKDKYRERRPFILLFVCKIRFNSRLSSPASFLVGIKRADFDEWCEKFLHEHTYKKRRRKLLLSFFSFEKAITRFPCLRPSTAFCGLSWVSKKAATTLWWKREKEMCIHLFRNTHYITFRGEDVDNRFIQKPFFSKEEKWRRSS